MLDELNQPRLDQVTVHRDPDEWVEIDRLLEGSQYLSGMVVGSGRCKELYRRVQRLAAYKTNVLVQGESGTGKELVARALHDLSAEPDGPFVIFNCSNLVSSLAESQLFGHVRGAFTDARYSSLGYFRAAQGGTLFLDEIGELPLHLQPKLLRAVENHEIQPVGSSYTYRVDLRLVAATNRNLTAMVLAGTFREDLFYRLSGISVVVPALRERREAICALAGHFLLHHGKLLGKPVTHISRRALDALVKYDWPGNVRELEHTIKHALMLAETARIDLDDLPQHQPELAAQKRSTLTGRSPRSLAIRPAAPSGPASLSLETLTKAAVLRSLQGSKGNRQQAARVLGISRPKLYRMLERYDLTGSGR
jgi:two-component system, NtrC family, response regulator AtoC